MPESQVPPRTQIRTVIGAVLGFVLTVCCWLGLFILAVIDDSGNWKGVLLIAAVVLPVILVSGGAWIARNRRR